MDGGVLKEYVMVYEFYKKCKACDGYGGVHLHMNDPDELDKWAKRLGQDFAYCGYNTCNKCDGGMTIEYILPDLELE